MKFSKNIIFLFSLLISLTVQAQNKRDSLLSQLMRTYHNYNMFDGAVLVAEKGEIVYKEAFGMANREWDIPNSVDTKFMIGSISKPLTATLALILVQKGLLGLDNTVDEYLPEFRNKPAAKVTIRQLMSHRSGIPNYDIIKDFFPRISRQSFSRSEYVKIYNDSALAFEPGTRYLYSSWGYFTLGYIIEKVTGKTYAEAMRDEIFSKLDMQSSGSYLHTQIVPKRASGYDYGLGYFLSGDFRDQSNTMGTGDIYTTVEDLFKFHLSITNHTLINKALTDEMLAPGKLRYNNYGFGWFNQIFKYTDRDSLKVNYHLGSTDGFISFLLREPETNSLVVLLSNSAPIDYFGITKNILKILHEKPVILKEPVHKKMETLIGKNGAASAVADYQKMKMDTAHYAVDWLQMYYLVENLVSLKLLDDARIMAENNVLEFPQKELMALSLANIYLALDKKSEAVQYYKKTLQINPENEEAKNRLKEIKIE